MIAELAASLPAGAIAFVDADWLGAGVPPALVYVDGTLRFADGAPVALSDDIEPELAAALALGAVARGAADAASGVSGPTEVQGRGLVATLTRELLAWRRQARREPPAAIVDTTGDPEALAAAASRVADLGMLVLAGERRGLRLPFDLYRDVHRRGLSLVGVPPPLAAGSIALNGGHAWPPPGDAEPGGPLSPARWYRVRT